MGIFDKIKKAADAVADILDDGKLNNSNKNGSKTTAPAASAPAAKPAQPAAPAKTTPQILLDTGERLPAPMRRVCSTFYGGENSDEYEMRFLITSDFVEFDSHCELSPSFQFEPGNEEGYTSYKEGYPQLVFGPNDKVYHAIDAFLADGTQSGENFEKSDIPYFLFKARFEDRGQMIYAYGFSPKSANDHLMLGVIYNPDAVGTALEKKLVSILDTVALTYREAKVE